MSCLSAIAETVTELNCLLNKKSLKLAGWDDVETWHRCYVCSYQQLTTNSKRKNNRQNVWRQLQVRELLTFLTEDNAYCYYHGMLLPLFKKCYLTRMLNVTLDADILMLDIMSFESP